jgi:GNAT superfamily N-acetyltransferase
MIEVKPEYRRQGIATAMFDYIRSEYNDYYVDWGFTTPDGTKLKDALTTTVKNPEYENLEKSIDTLNKLLEKCEIKLNDDDWLENAPQDEKLKVANKWDMIYSKKRDLEHDMEDLREYITTWK